MKKYLSLMLLLALLLACSKSEEPNSGMEQIKYINRSSGETEIEKVPGEGMLKWLYSSATGKAALNMLFKRKFISSLGGWYMDTKMSAKRIPGFVAEHGINMKECKVSEITDYSTFNQFFYRKLKPNARAIGNNLVSPADGKILAFQSLNDVSSFFIKGSEFTLQFFLQSEKLAAKYKDGAMAIIRLAPADYHRFHFPASGKASESTAIKGHYFSVSPLALRKSLKIFFQNYREYCTLQTQKSGDILISDVGATMVGSIIQTYQPNTEVKKGDEKGYFAFGGSTLVLLFEKGKIQFDEDIIANTNNGLETTVQMGENIAQ